MSFIYSEYIILVIFAWLMFTIFYFKLQRRFFDWIKDHWFYSRAKQHKLSSIFYVLGLLLLGLALLDLRGPEKLIEGKTQDQKTIILLDSSASMLAEDVRPNRFNRALVLAKHYIKRAVGQKISLVVFSDKTKRIVPFTEDTNLIDARIESLKKLDIGRGGTSLSLAIQESLQYFVNNDGEKSGNILIFTDAEETDGGINLEIPKDISVAIVGIGTAKGSTVPNRNSRGIFKGNKKFEGKLVISKLDENFIKSLGDKIENFQYWIATSYTLPTAEIINFFSRIHEAKNQENSFRVRPVLANYLMIPGVIFLILSFVIGKRKMLFLSSLLMMFSMLGFAEEVGDEPVKSEKTIALEELFRKGELDRRGKEALASSLLKDNFNEEAAKLYDEIMDPEITEENKLNKLNQATSKIKAKKIKEGIDEYNKLVDFLKENKSEENKKLLDVTNKNLAKLFQQSPQGGKGSSSDESDSDESNDQNQQQDQSSEGGGEGKQGEQNEDKKNEGKDKKDKKNKEGDDKKSDKDKDSDGGEGDKKKDKKKKPSKPESSDEKNKRKKKLPALLKQLVNDDNQLQKKLIDGKTTKRKQYGTKDW